VTQLLSNARGQQPQNEGVLTVYPKGEGKWLDVGSGMSNVPDDGPGVLGVLVLGAVLLLGLGLALLTHHDRGSGRRW
jgi:hypothetical protein